VQVFAAAGEVSTSAATIVVSTSAATIVVSNATAPARTLLANRPIPESYSVFAARGEGSGFEDG
jgi:hypothetical protein